MKTKIIKYIYFYYSILIVLFGVTTKLFLVDPDIGARFKNFDHRLLASDIAFLCALILGFAGFLFLLIRRNKKSTLRESTIQLSFVLIFPFSFILAITPLLETIRPGEVGGTVFGVIFTFISIVAVFAAIIWIILIIVTFLKQLLIILK